MKHTRSKLRGIVRLIHSFAASCGEFDPPWIKDPRPVLALLDKLKADPVLMVRRSVANNLNDISKDNPVLVVETLQAWQKTDNEGTQWIIGHAARTLVKQGHHDTLMLLGYSPTRAVRVSAIRLNKTTIHLGEDFVFEFEIYSEADLPQNLVVDYVIHHMKANGKTTPKVFKLTTKQLKGGHDTLKVSQKHSFRPLTTRKYYPGKHVLEIQINGEIHARIEFELKQSV
jgi:hypothetical protein